MNKDQFGRGTGEFARGGHGFSHSLTEEDPAFLDHLKAGRYIEAVKYYREQTGHGLRESKQAVDQVLNRLHASAPSEYPAVPKSPRFLAAALVLAGVLLIAGVLLVTVKGSPERQHQSDEIPKKIIPSPQGSGNSPDMQDI